MKEQAEKLIAIEKEISKSKGPFEFFALFLQEDSTGDWDLLISSDWARSDRYAAIEYVVEKIRKVFSDREMLMLSKVVILDKDHESLKTLPSVPVEHGLAEIYRFDFFGIAIKYAYLITFKKGTAAIKEQAEKLIDIEKEISESKGSLEFFALFLREDSPGKWDLLISSDWARSDRYAAIEYVVEKIRKVFSDEEMLMLSHVAILDKDHESLKTLPSAAVEHGLAEIYRFDFFGKAIKYAYLITFKKSSMVRLPSNRPPVHPGEILLKEYIKPYGLTQAEVARKIGVSAKKLSAVIHAVKAVDTDMALRLGKLFGTSPELWLNGQNAWDIWQASHNEKKQRTLKEIAPLKAHAVT